MKSGQIMIELGEARYNVVFCSVRGEGKIENQDSMNVYYDENQIILVVADGLGSAIYSKEGSETIVSLATRLLSERNDLSKIYRDLQTEWICSLEGNINLYDTTIKFIKITRDQVYYGGVGDGWIAFQTSDGFLDMISQNSFSNQTDTILSFDLKNKFCIRTIQVQTLSTALIATDGFSEDIDKENASDFLDAVSQKLRESSEEFQREIEQTLSKWPVPTNQDDKTVIFIERVNR